VDTALPRLAGANAHAAACKLVAQLAMFTANEKKGPISEDPWVTGIATALTNPIDVVSGDSNTHILAPVRRDPLVSIRISASAEAYNTAMAQCRQGPDKTVARLLARFSPKFGAQANWVGLTKPRGMTGLQLLWLILNLHGDENALPASALTTIANIDGSV
jgi:hypothetical protein